MAKVNHTISGTQRRRTRVRAVLHGTEKRPRISVFRSNKHLFIQAIDDDRGHTLVAVGEKEVKEGENKTARGVAVAVLFAEKMKKAKIHAGVFDRGSYRYHGRIKAVAEKLREAGVHI